MPRKKTDVSVEAVAKDISVGSSELAKALVEAINAAKPIEKKNPFNRKVLTPWTPKDGAPKLKAKRKIYQHSLLLDPDKLDNEEIDLCNRVRPGTFCDGYVKIIRRRDKGIDIDYPVKTASQRLRLVNQFGIRNLKELLARCIEEAEHPPAIVEDVDNY